MSGRVTHREKIFLFKIEEATWPVDYVTLRNQYVCKIQDPNALVARCLTDTDIKNRNSHLWVETLATSTKNHFLQECTPTRAFCHAAVKPPFKYNFWLWEGIPKQAEHHFSPVRGFIYFDLRWLMVYNFSIFNLCVICSEETLNPVLQTLATRIK